MARVAGWAGRPFVDWRSNSRTTKGRLKCSAVRPTRRTSSTRPRRAIDQQLAAYKEAGQCGRPRAGGPCGQVGSRCLRAALLQQHTLVLDRYFVHRLRAVTGKDGNALNEVELMSDSLINNDGVLRGNKVIKLIPDQSVLKLDIGDRIRLGAADFERLSKAFLAEIRSRFLPASEAG
jgi:hypothetical protein